MSLSLLHFLPLTDLASRDGQQCSESRENNRRTDGQMKRDGRPSVMRGCEEDSMRRGKTRRQCQIPAEAPSCPRSRGLVGCVHGEFADEGCRGCAAQPLAPQTKSILRCSPSSSKGAGPLFPSCCLCSLSPVPCRVPVPGPKRNRIFQETAGTCRFYPDPWRQALDGRETRNKRKKKTTNLRSSGARDQKTKPRS